MVGFVILFSLIILISLYFVIKWAVRAAILEADDIRANVLLNSNRSKISKTECPACKKKHDTGHLKCPHCQYIDNK